MKTVKRHNITSKLLRRLAGTFEVPWFFWGSAVCLGCAVFLSAASLYPLWMLLKPRPTTVAQPLLNTPLEPLAPWLPFLLLYVPDMLLLFASGVFAGCCARRKWLRWLSTCVTAYTVLSVAFGGSIWQRSVVAAFQVNLLDLRYAVLCLVILSSAYVGAFAAILLRSSHHKRGHCPRCGYSLYGLPSPVCPECGRTFSPSEAEDAEGESKVPDSQSIDRIHRRPLRIWIARPVLLVRACVVGVLLLFYYGLNWMPLRVALRDAIGWLLSVAAYDPVAFMHDGSPAVRVGEEVYFYTPVCTYIHLLMIVAPFVWVVGASRRSNILRIAIAVVVILGGNLVRCWASVYFNLLGTDWFYTHDLPNYTLGIGMVAIAVLGSLRRDFDGGSTSTAKAHSTEPASEAVVIGHAQRLSPRGMRLWPCRWAKLRSRGW